MSDPDAGFGAARLVETHTAIVVFVGDRAYKLKKSLDLGFLDHRLREARLRSCREEVELNARLAPDVYLDVLDVTGSDGEVQDHLVAMRRMPEDRRLSRCVERGEDLDDALHWIARAVATLHAGSPRSAHHDRNASRDAVAQRWADSFEQIEALVPDQGRLDLGLDRIRRQVEHFLAGREPLFDRRVADGRVRDGHGDLQAEDIFVLEDHPRILDCIEFDADYRWGDELSDVAFLAMDLERLGRGDLGTRFLGLHRELTADRWPRSLAHHFVAYRAHVRAKVTMMRHAAHDEPFGPDVEVLLALALRHLDAGEVRLVVVGGLPGTGKSTLAAALGEELGAVVLRTDEIRLGTGGPKADYSPGAVDAVYVELLEEAEQLLSLGESVVLDASWSNPAHRERARAVAARTHSRIDEVCCALAADEARSRIERRLRAGDDPSEATPAVAREMAERFAPWPEASTVSTAPAPDEVLAATRRALAASDLVPGAGIEPARPRRAGGV